MYFKYDGSVALESAANTGVNLWASGPDQTLQGSALNDVLGGAGQDTLIGGLGDNQYYLSGWGNVVVQGATGVNTVTTWMSTPVVRRRLDAATAAVLVAFGLRLGTE